MEGSLESNVAIVFHPILYSTSFPMFSSSGTWDFSIPVAYKFNITLFDFSIKLLPLGLDHVLPLFSIQFAPVAQWVKNPPLVRRPRRFGFSPWVRKMPWKKKWQPNPVLLLEKIPCTEELWSTAKGLQRVGLNWVSKHWSIQKIVTIGYHSPRGTRLLLSQICLETQWGDLLYHPRLP